MMGCEHDDAWVEAEVSLPAVDFDGRASLPAGEGG